MSIHNYYFGDYKKPGGMKDLLAMAFPMMISTACDGVMTFTDRLFLSRVGSEQMNAALGGGLSYQMLTFFFIGLIGYSTALVAQYYGARDFHHSPKAGFQAILVAIAAWPVILLLKPLMVSLFDVLQFPETQVGYQVDYLNILVWGGLFGLLRHTLGCYFTGIGKTRIVMTATMTAMIVNVILDYILIFGHYGMPAMGVRGAAIATVCGSLTAVLMLLSVYFGRWNRTKYQVMKSFRFDWSIMKKLLHFGYPAGLEFLLNFIAMFVMTGMLQSQGPSEATATTIMFNWDLVSYIPLLGIEVAVTSLVGRYMGAGRPQVAHRAALSAIKTGLIYSFIILVLFMVIPEALVRVFHPETTSDVFEKAVPVAKLMIRFASLYVMAQAVMVAMIGTLRGAGDTFYTMVVSVLASWAFLPLVYLCLFVFDTNVAIAWLAVILIYMLFCLVIYRRFRTEKWKKIHVI